MHLSSQVHIDLYSQWICKPIPWCGAFCYVQTLARIRRESKSFLDSSTSIKRYQEHLWGINCILLLQSCTSLFRVTFWSPKWRSFIPRKGQSEEPDMHYLPQLQHVPSWYYPACVLSPPGMRCEMWYTTNQLTSPCVGLECQPTIPNPFHLSRNCVFVYSFPVPETGRTRSIHDQRQQTSGVTHCF